jgi:two-component system OmpR family sensor kinase
LALLFIASIKYDKLRFEDYNDMHERLVTHYLYNYYMLYGKIDEAYLESQNFSVIKDKEKIIQIEHYFKDKGKYKKYAVDHYKLQRIVLINNDRFKLILANKNRAKFPFKRIVVFSIVFILVILLYFWVIKSLQPLSELKNKIKKFSKGDLNIECKSDKKDEIAEVANEFDNAVKMIRELIQSRQLFLRAIMHELKTPIGKGRLISEMLNDEKSKQRLHKVFERLNMLIDEFAKIEQITSNNYEFNPKPYKVSDILEASIDMLLIDNPTRYICLDIKQDYILTVDFELFALVLKNLIDNAIKYSSDKKVHICIDQKHITISNNGHKLKGDINDYYKPFHHTQGGLGLGIYIVKHILDMHDMKLVYLHKDGVNSFTIL